jgi:hypothetical protein
LRINKRKREKENRGDATREIDDEDISKALNFHEDEEEEERIDID